MFKTLRRFPLRASLWPNVQRTRTLQIMASTRTSKMNVVFGAMTLGDDGLEGARIHSPTETAEVLDVFQKHGFAEVDTARVYTMGTSEEYLGAVDWQKRGIVMETKLYPTASKDMSKISSEIYSHNAKDVRAGLMASLKALKADKIEMFYLHGPDRTVPFAETLEAVNTLHKEGYFNRFGISNFQSWEVAEICEICNKHGWIKPTAYQGIYNALHRGIEAELVPCLRFYGISIYGFQPLAGGFLTGKFTKDTTEFDAGSRFDPKRWQGALHHTRYWNDEYFAAMNIIKAATDKYGLTVTEAALRWVEHHSLMSVEKGDAIIIGASSAKQLEANLVDLEKGELPADVVEAMDIGWKIVKGRVPNYWH